MTYTSLTYKLKWGMMMIIIETRIFTKLIEDYFSDDEYRKLQEYLALFPDAGDVMRGSGGLRKLRWRQKGRGKRGGVRIIYYWITAEGKILMLYLYSKNIKDDLSNSELKLIKKIVDEEFS